MKIWAIKSPIGEVNQDVMQFLTDSLKSGISRFGWGYSDELDLENLVSKLDRLNKKEIEAWSKSNFLRNIKEGDWVVHINLPKWGSCIAAQVIGKYEYEKIDNIASDFRHMIKIDTDSLIIFDRNDIAVLPNISARLKLQGSHWTISNTEDFLQTIQNLKSSNLNKSKNDTVGIFHLKESLNPILKSITEKIHKSHPGARLESLIAEVFRRVPSVISVNENGKKKGWGTDYGADLIVTYSSGLGVANLEKEDILVVQVKSFEGNHNETNSVNQIENAIKQYNATAGLIISTAQPTENLQKAIDELSKSLDKSVGLMAGEDVAKFVLNHGGELVL